MKKFWIMLICVALLFTMMPLAVAADTYECGNVDGEGEITANDALLALQAATSKVDLSAEQLAAADVDGEDGVAANDALLILQYATKKITSFPNKDNTTVDLKGAEIVIAAMDTSCFALDGTESHWAERIVDELDAVGKELNCTFKVNIYDSFSLTEECIEADTSDQKFADILITNVWQQKPLIKAKALTDLNTVSGLDLSKSYWDQNAGRDMQLYGKNFMGMTTLDGTAANANVLYFNKVLAKVALEKAGYTVESPEAAANILYDMVEDGTWTFDKLLELSQYAKKDLNNNGIMDYKTPADQYGFSGVDFRTNIAMAAFKANGGYFTKKDNSGNVVFALDDAGNVPALKTIQTWLLEDDSVYNLDKYANNLLASVDAFIAGRVLFLSWMAGEADAFADMTDEWGILPYPKANETDDYTGTIDWNTQGFSIPRTVTGTDLTNTAAVLNAIAQRFQIIREEKDAYMAENVYRDTQSADMMRLIEAAATVDFVQYGDLGAGGMNTLAYLFDSTKNDPATRIENIRDSSITALNEFLAAVK